MTQPRSTRTYTLFPYPTVFRSPGMNVSNGGTPGQTTITLRGVAPLNASQTVGIYLDDAPVGSSAIYNRAGQFTIDLMPYDLERIEVLKGPQRSEEHTSELQSLMRISSAVFCLEKKKIKQK